MIRAILAVITAILAYWVASLALPIFHMPGWLNFILSLAIAVVAGALAWRRLEAAAGLVKSILIGALVVGAIGFCVGFFGPLIWAPDANQGPLLGIFITGPLGALAGGLWWSMRRKRTTRPT